MADRKDFFVRWPPSIGRSERSPAIPRSSGACLTLPPTTKPRPTRTRTPSSSGEDGEGGYSRTRLSNSRFGFLL
jgi:hypothetical protein